MASFGRSIAAIACAVIGGVMNSTWPLYSKPESPNFLRIASHNGWQWENVWLPFIIWSSVLNATLCMAVVGPSTLSAVYRKSSPFEVGLVCTFGFLWGSGTACFSLGIKLLGAGPGTALVMSLLVVIGTLLPLIEDHADDAGSPEAVVTIVGLLFAITGFVASAQSSRIKARAIDAAGSKQGKGDVSSVDVEVANNNAAARGKDAPGSSGSSDPVDTSVSTCSFASSVGTVSDRNAAATATATAAKGEGEGAKEKDADGNSKAAKVTLNVMHKAGAVGALQAGAPQDLGADAKEGGGKSNHLAAVAVCVLGAVMSSMLQFSFVYGDPLITLAEEEEGVSSAGAPFVVWLLAFSLASVGNVGYAIYLLQANSTWSRYTWEGRADFLKKTCNIAVMGAFFVGHIHLYGLSQYLFGGLGPVVAWPLIMSSTVLSGQVWGVFMKEWVGVPRLAMQVNIASIVILIVAVTIIAIAGTVF